MPKTLARGAMVPGKSKENEVFLAVNELQKLARAVYHAGAFTLSTSDAVAHTVWTSEDMPEGALWSFVVSAQAQVPGGAGFAHIVRSALYQRLPGGVTTQFGTGTAIVTNRADANLQLQSSVSGNAVIFQVVDALARSLNWAIWLEARVSI
jgi:hypothetical protein